MKIFALVLLSCVLWEVQAYPYPYYPYYGDNVDTLSYGASDNSRGGMVLSRYYNPYYSPRTVGGMAAFMFKPPEEQSQYQPSQYYLPDRRRQTPQETNFNLIPPQENEVYYPQVPEKPTATEVPVFADPTEKTEVIPTTVKTIVPEIIEPEVEEVEPEQPRRRVPKRKQVKKPVDDDEDDDYTPRMPTGAFFPMFFGYGRSGHGGTPGGATAIANAYSTGRGGVATSHATAYGGPRPDESKIFQQQPFDVQRPQNSKLYRQN